MAYSMSGSSEQASNSFTKDIGPTPVAEAPKSCAPVPEQSRKIAPRTARPSDPQNSLDEQAVVTAAASGVGWLAQTMRFHLRPLGVSQYESIHPKLESHPSFIVNPHSP
jgi:hypothetical protein